MNAGTVHGFTVAITWAAVILLGAAVIAVTLVNAHSPRTREASEAAAAAG